MPLGGRAIAITALLFLSISAGPAAGQSPASRTPLPRPGASSLWVAPAPPGVSAGVGPASGSDRQHRGMLIGFAAGATVAGLLGNHFCQQYGSTERSCLGTAMWWGAIGGMLGAVMGASAAADPGLGCGGAGEKDDDS